MLRGAEEFVWQEIFQFPAEEDLTESVVWRREVPEDAAVHAMGCDKQARDRSRGKAASTYRGFIDATAEAVRGVSTTRGHTVFVVHAPAEGEWHVHLKVVLAQGVQKLSKGDKSDIRAVMEGIFGPLQAHVCP